MKRTKYVNNTACWNAPNKTLENGKTTENYEEKKTFTGNHTRHMSRSPIESNIPTSPLNLHRNIPTVQPQ
jgi:hypothetical protein